MRHPNPAPRRVLITHIVNPHQFYYKYTDHIVDGTFSKFDFEIQLYGIELHAQRVHENGYVPVENELVIFYDVIHNKWIRGRVISVGPEITFWCIDNGVWQKLAAPHVLPLAEQFHKDTNLVHVGGLSLLPTEKTWNVETEEVQTQLSKGWDEKSVNLLKGIISKSKTFLFTEQFQMVDHKFGSLVIESKAANRKEINQILIEMNSAAPSHQYSDEDLWPYVHDARMKEQLCKSIVDASSIRVTSSTSNVLSTSAIQRTFQKYGSEISSVENLAPSEYFDDTASRQSSDISTTLEPYRTPHASGRQCDVDSDEDRKPARVEAMMGKDYNDLSDSVSLSSTVTADASGIVAKPNRRSESDSKFPYEECFMRTCNIADTDNVRQQPLRSTMDWIKSMSKSISSDTACGSDRSCASDDASNANESRCNSRTASTSTTASRRDILASLNKNGPTTVDNTAKSSPDVVNSRFGIPAGYSKNCLNSFGGMNRKSAT